MSGPGVVLVIAALLWGLLGTATGQLPVPAQSYACSRLAPIGLPHYPHTCALVRPHRDGTASLWLQRNGQTYEFCRTAAPYGPPGAYCR